MFYNKVQTTGDIQEQEGQIRLDWKQPAQFWNQIL